MDSVILQKLLHEIIALDLGTDLFFFLTEIVLEIIPLSLGSHKSFLKKFLLL